MAKKNGQRADDSRRGLLTALGGLVGMAALSACTDDSLGGEAGDAELAKASAALSVDLDYVINVSALALLPAPTAGSPRAVMVLGLTPSAAAPAAPDGTRGGEGLFIWDAACTTPPDGARFIAPPVPAGQTMPSGRWVRYIDGLVVTPWQFGPIGTGNDGPAIQAALDFLAAVDGGGTLLIPTVFVVTGQAGLLIRQSSSPIRILGAGLARSGILWAETSAPETTPLIGFEAPPSGGPPSQVLFFRMEHLALKRTSPGQVFRYEPHPAANPSADAPQAYRFEYGTIRHVRFETERAGNEHCFFLMYGGNSRFEHLQFSGGAEACLFHTTQRCIFQDLRVLGAGPVQGSTSGMRFYRVGDSSITNLRVENVISGFGVLFEECGLLYISGIGLEGSKSTAAGVYYLTNPALFLSNCQLCVISNINIPGPSAHASTQEGQLGDNSEIGVRLSACSGIQFIGGFIYGYNQSQGRTILVDYLCTDIRFQDVAVDLGTVADMSGGVQVEGTRNRLDLIWVNTDGGIDGRLKGQGRQVVRSPVPLQSLPIAGNQLDVRSSDEYRIQGQGVISTIVNGYAGQRLVLDFTWPYATVVNGSNILLAGGADFATGGAGGTLTLLFDGISWRELSRAVFP